MEAAAILQSVFVLALLTLGMTIWMIAIRISETNRRGINAQEAQDPRPRLASRNRGDRVPAGIVHWIRPDESESRSS